MDMSASSPQRHVICMKWGTKYGPEYVNRLYAMVRRHLTLDFQLPAELKHINKRRRRN